MSGVARATRDGRLRGHPPPVLAKWEAEGRSCPRDPFATPETVPLHYPLHEDGQRVVLGQDGTPLLHHRAVEVFMTQDDTAKDGTPRRWLTVPEVARLLEQPPQAIRRAIQRGALPAEQPLGFKGLYRVPVGSLEDHLYRIGMSHSRVRELKTTWEAWTAGHE